MFSSSKTAKLMALAAAGALIAVILFAGEPATQLVLAVAEWVRGLGWLAPVAFTTVLAVAVPVFIPAAPFLITSGFLFGPVIGTFCGTLGNLSGGALAFAIARYLVRHRVEKALASNPGFEAMNHALGQEGTRGVALIRLSPALPAWLISYALGVSRISWRQYWASAPAILPVTVLYALAGSGLGDLAAMEAGGGLEKGTGYYALLGLGIAATLVVSVLLGRRAQKILEELDDDSSA